MDERAEGFIERRWLPWLIVGLGLAIRLALAPWGAHPGDIATLARWAETIRAQGWLNVYTASDANYPPLGTLLVAWSALFPVHSRLWLVAIKLPAIMADAGIMGLAWRASAGTRRSVRLALLISAALNPALILMSGWWGQFESVYALGALAAVLLALDGRFGWAGAALGAGMLVKVQGIVVLPVVGLVAIKQLIHRRERKEGLFNIPLAALGVGSVAALGIGMGPFIARGQGRFVVERSLALVAGPGWLTVNALNLWYLVTGGAGNWAFNAPLLTPDSMVVFAGLSARALGLALLAAWTGLVLGLAWRRNDRRGWLLASALLYLGVFFWPTQAHERYAFGAVVFSLAYGGVSPIASPRQAGYHDSGGQRNSTIGGWQPLLIYAIITLSHAANLAWAVLAGNRALGLALAILNGGAALAGLGLLSAQGDR